MSNTTPYNLYYVVTDTYTAVMAVADKKLDKVKIHYTNDTLDQVLKDYQAYNVGEWAEFYYRCLINEANMSRFKTVAFIDEICV